MKRFVWASLVTMTFGLAPASAQLGVYQRPYQPRSPFSPYLNLNRGGNPAINYYGLVRPRFDTTRALQNVQAQLQTGSGVGTPLPPASDGQVILPITGHPVTFMNTSHYFTAGGVRAGGAAVVPGFGTPASAGQGSGITPIIPITTGTVRR